VSARDLNGIGNRLGDDGKGRFANRVGASVAGRYIIWGGQQAAKKCLITAH